MKSKKTICLCLSMIIASCSIFISCSSSSSHEEPVFLQTTVTPANAGTVSPANGEFNPGDQVQLTATPNSNWIFKEWNGDHTGTANPASFTIRENMNIQALFEQLMFSLTVNKEGEGSVSESIVNAKTDYAAGTMVQLKAEPADEWRFEGWSGHLEGDDNPAILTMDSDKEVNAHFLFGIDEQFEQENPENIIFSDSRVFIENGQLKFSAGPDGNWGGVYFNQSFTDFRIETRVSRFESLATRSNSIAFFIRSNGFRWDPNPTGYHFLVTQGGVFRVTKFENGVRTNLIPWTNISSNYNIALGGFNTIAVNVKGDRFDFFANDNLLITIFDDSIKSGFPSVAANAGDNGTNLVKWDYVKLTPAEDMSGQQGKLATVNLSSGMPQNNTSANIHGYFD